MRGKMKRRKKMREEEKENNVENKLSALLLTLSLPPMLILVRHLALFPSKSSRKAWI